MAFDPISAALDIGGKLIDRLWPNPVEAEKAKYELFKLQQSGELQLAVGQMEINKVEASSTNLFVSGWRPWVGWVGGISLAYIAILEPILRFVSVVYFQYTGSFPVIDTTISLQVLMGMLGFGGLRTYEKLKDVATK